MGLTTGWTILLGAAIIGTLALTLWMFSTFDVAKPGDGDDDGE
jgi:hypothetical protein